MLTSNDVIRTDSAGMVYDPQTKTFSVEASMIGYFGVPKLHLQSHKTGVVKDFVFSKTVRDASGEDVLYDLFVCGELKLQVLND